MPITNTLENYEKLHEAGIPEKHANAISQVVENAVYKSQEELKYFIKDLFVEFELKIDARISNLEEKIDAKINNLEARMETKMLSIKNETLKWMISLAFLSITAIIAILKFTGH